MRKKVSTLLVILLIVALLPINAFAGSSDIKKANILSKHSVTVGVGQTVSIKTVDNSAISSASCDTSCAKITTKKYPATSIDFKGVSVGLCEVTVTGKDNKSFDSILITVKSAPTKLVFSKSSVTIGVGEKLPLGLTSIPQDAHSGAKYTLSTKSFITVNSAGEVTGKKVGTTTVTATAYNGVSVKCKVVVKKAPKSADIKLSKTSLVIGLGDSFKFFHSFTDSTYWSSYTYSVVNSEVASLSGNVLTAVSEGDTVVKLKLGNGATASCNVKVIAPPSAVKLVNSIKLGVGETYTLKSSFTPSLLTYLSATYSSTSTSVATVSAGVITACKTGTASISSTAYNGVVSNDCTVNVAPAPKSVSLNKTKVTIGIGETVQLKASFPSNSYSNTQKYSSKSSSIANVNSTGLVTGKKVGTTTVTVKTFNGKSATCTVVVKKAPKSITFNSSAISLGLGEVYKLGTTLSTGSASHSKVYTTSDSSIVKISSSGYMEGVSLGTAVIKVKTYNGKTATCTVTVKNAPESLKLNCTSKTIVYGSALNLKATVNTDSASATISWYSSNNSIATVNSTGSITTKGYGTCYIYAETYNGIKTKCKLKVKRGKYSYLMYSYTTYFPLYTNVGKPVNLKLACKYINGSTGGKVVKSGDTFSFNKVVGQRTRARGFVDAAITTGSTYTDGIGGGVCQAATTIFNAAFFANFSIVERSCHQMKSSYCPAGMDAAIYWGSQDMKFKNNYNCAIKVVMQYNAGGSITCKIYSNKDTHHKKVKSKVTYNSKTGVYTTKRYCGKKCNYTTYSKYIKHS